MRPPRFASRPNRALAPRLARDLVILSATALLAGCEQSPEPNAPAPTAMSATARRYLVGALDTMQRHSIRKHAIEWPTLRATALERAGLAQAPAHTYAAIVDAVYALGDGHSQFFPPDGYPVTSALATAAIAPRAQSTATLPGIPMGRMLDARIAYVYVPAFSGSSGARARADSTLDIVRTLDRNGGGAAPCGWLVDLRGNGGGNMYPMVAGLGPLIGDGIAGVFMDADDVPVHWYHRAGEVGTRFGTTDTPSFRVTTPYALRRTSPAIAVLHGFGTASSGEATAISFIGLPNARSFGTPSYGLTTGNRPFRLSDGAVLNLAAALMGDRTGRLYGAQLMPDEATGEFTTDPRSLVVDEAMRAAMTWVAGQPSCAGAASTTGGA